MNRTAKVLPSLFLLAVAVPSSIPQAARAAQAAQAAPQPVNESFQYRWQLRNFVGAIAGLFLPRQGKGELSFKSQGNGHLRTELLITSPSSESGEYWRYGADIDPRTQQTLRAWSSYLFRGEQKSKSAEIDADGVFDVVSGIYSIRRDPPTRPRKMEIWSDGKIYPVVVIPGDKAKKRVGKREVLARRFTIRGDDSRVEGNNRKWKGRLELWLAQDETATPVEIMISRNLADVRLQLVSS